jgi:alpha 1,2-mannosyltransferase
VNGDIVFLHRNLLKWDITKPEELVWQKIKRFLPDAKIKEYYIEVSTPNGHLYTDLRGDVEEIDFRKIFGSFEEQCLADLAELRDSILYARYMRHYHFANRRYPKHITFSIDG